MLKKSTLLPQHHFIDLDFLKTRCMYSIKHSILQSLSRWVTQSLSHSAYWSLNRSVAQPTQRVQNHCGSKCIYFWGYSVELTVQGRVSKADRSNDIVEACAQNNINFSGIVFVSVQLALATSLEHRLLGLTLSFENTIRVHMTGISFALSHSL